MAPPKKKPRGALGKGLGAILEDVGAAYANEMSSRDDFSNTATLEAVSNIDVELIDPNPYQPRKNFDEQKIKELAKSIDRHGLLQPIVVIPNGDRYLLIAGERRLRAHKEAKIDSVKAIVADVNLDEIRMRELALIENIQRENLNPLELAISYKELIDVHNVTHEGLSEIVHKSRSQITNTLRLLMLGKYAQDALLEERITQGHAKILVSLDEDKQKVAVDTIVGQKLNVRETERMMQSGDTVSPKRKKDTNSFVILEKDKKLISSLLPFGHVIKKNKIEIVLRNDKELEEFISFYN